jgi:hypothetical protein
MRPGEVMELQTPNVVVAVRGTVLVVEIVPAGSGAQPAASPAAITTTVSLLHGSVDVALRNDPTAPPVHLDSLQAVGVSRDTFGPVRSLSPEAVAAATSGVTTNELARPGPPAAFLSALVAQQQTLVGVIGALPRGPREDDANSTDTRPGASVSAATHPAANRSSVTIGLTDCGLVESAPPFDEQLR